MEYLPAWMFLALTILLMAGFPVTFTLMGTALVFGLIGFGWSFFNLLPLRIWGVMTNVTLIAVPLFVFMGVMLERSGLAEELLDTMGLLFGRLRGGLAISVVVVGALLGASTGIVGATVVTMGLLAVPTMLRRGYQKELATGTVAASGTLGQIIPPSIVLVLIGDIVGVPVGDLFMGAVLPGMVLVGLVHPLHSDHLDSQAKVRPGHSPGGAGRHFPKTNAVRVCKALLPPLALMIAVLGSIFAGIASPTEAAAVGAVGATVLTIANRKFNLTILREVMQTTVRLTCMVFIILCGAAAFGLVFRGLGGDGLVREFLGGLAAKYSAQRGSGHRHGPDFLHRFFPRLYRDHVYPRTGAGPDHDRVRLRSALVLHSDRGQPADLVSDAALRVFAVLPESGDAARNHAPVTYTAASSRLSLFQLIGLLIIVFFPKLATWLPQVVFGS